MKPKHTPGPWFVIQHLNPGHRDPDFSICTTKDCYPCDANPKDCSLAGIWSGDPVDLANARLMAAAPDLLGALETIMQMTEAFEGSKGLLMEIRRICAPAIVKAKEGDGS